MHVSADVLLVRKKIKMLSTKPSRLTKCLVDYLTYFKNLNFEHKVDI